MLPLIGLLASALTGAGIFSLYWYTNLSNEDQRRADELAVEYAWSLYEKGLSELTSAQLRHVQDLVKKSFSAN